MVKLKVKGEEYLKSLFSRFTFYVKIERDVKNKSDKKTFREAKSHG